MLSFKKIKYAEDLIHPELKPGEVFFTNSDILGFEGMPWKTKRKGNIAYDGKGNLTGNENWFPVFLREKEIIDADINLIQIRKHFRLKRTT